MNRFTLNTTTILVSVAFGSGVFADQGATEILEEYFANFENGVLTVDVGDKDDAFGYTQWNNVILSSKDAEFQIAVPFIRVEKNLLGGYQLTYSPSVKGAVKSPDPDVLEPLEFVISNTDLTIDIGGSLGARSYDSKVGSFSISSITHPSINFTISAKNGTSSQTLSNAGYTRMKGAFDFESMSFDYNVDIEGQEIQTSAVMNGMVGNFDFPFVSDIDEDNPMSAFDPSRDMFFDYATKGGSVQSNVISPAGPVKVDGSFGRGAATMGMKDSVFTMKGDSNDVVYNIDVASMGLPPIQVNMKSAQAIVTAPIDNQQVVKPAQYKIALTDLTMSDGVWAMFDPTRVLPRDPITMDIDLGANIRWLRPFSQLDKIGAGEMPLIAQSATINSINLKAAGAQVEATGDFKIDNSTFPPIPVGQIDASVKGSSALIEGLAKIGLIPAQYVLMSKGLTAMFFKQGGGADHLVTKLVFSKDGSISANGFPIK